MCSIDWAAAGTWAAVVAALAIAVSGGILSRLRDRVQGTLLASALHVETQLCLVHARALVRYLADAEAGGLLSVLMFRLASVPEELARLCSAFPTVSLDAAATRIHVLPLSCSRPIMDMRASISAVQVFGANVHTLAESRDPAVVEAAVASLRGVAAKLLAAAEAATVQVEKTAIQNPRWWQCIAS